MSYSHILSQVGANLALIFLAAREIEKNNNLKDLLNKKSMTFPEKNFFFLFSKGTVLSVVDNIFNISKFYNS